jgi:ribosomal protein S18 acetylase RimI-like enzyme
MAGHTTERMATRIVRPQSGVEWKAARRLVEEYVASLNLDLSFQDIARELEDLASEYAPPGGAFFLAEVDGAHMGCVGVRRFDDGIGEIKRLYTTAAGRNQGLGRQLAVCAIEAGGQLGYRCLRLDTLPSMKAAHALYTSLGFKPIAPYRYNPVEGTAFLELDLARQARLP